MERVREEGLEPSRSFDLNDLDVARLPFVSPFPHCGEGGIWTHEPPCGDHPFSKRIGIATANFSYVRPRADLNCEPPPSQGDDLSN